jgi:hypothetical protein
MKKSGWILALCVVALVGVGFWLLRGTASDQLQRQETIIDVEDTFEK